jgi:hypothetical protein
VTSFDCQKVPEQATGGTTQHLYSPLDMFSGLCSHDRQCAMQRAGLEEAVEAVLTTLGMAPCEGTDAVPPNARHVPCSSAHVIDGRDSGKMPRGSMHPRFSLLRTAHNMRHG